VTGQGRTQSLQSRALRHLARKAYSRAELRDRLLRWAGESETEQTLQSLEQLGLLNDAQSAYNYALHRLRDDGWGLLRVRIQLVRRGFSQSVIARAIERAGSEEDEEHALENYLERRLRRGKPPRGRGEIFRLYQHLRRRGFRSDLIGPALRRRLAPSSWIDIDTGE
jgi:regulatory protein